MSKFKRYLILTVFTFIAIGSLLAGGKQEKFLGTTWRGLDNPLFGTVFTQLTPENAGKWYEVQQSDTFFSWTILDKMIDIAEERDMLTKEHTLIWYQRMPRWLKPEEAEEKVNIWFASIAERYGTKIDMIDAVNEPLDGKPDYFSGIDCGEGEWDWVIWSFELARKYFPKAELHINEYDILNSSKKTAAYAEIIKALVDKKLVDAIGLQAHNLETTTPETIRANLETMKAFKLPIYITEWDLSIRDDEQQLQKVKEQFPIFWDDPQVKGITLWGFLSGQTARADAFLVRNDGSYRPAFQWMLDYKDGKR